MKKLILVLLALAISSCVNNKKYDMPEGIQSYQKVFDGGMAENISCFRIPAIITAPNGDLVAVADERVNSCKDLKDNKNINIVMRRSKDIGVTWLEIERVADFREGKSASDPSMIVDEITKEIFLFYNFMDLEKEKDVYYLHVMKSRDNGETWSEPEDITTQITGRGWHNDFKFITSGRGIQTKSGKLLHCLVNLKSGVYVFGSDDHGKTWVFIDTPIKPANESKIVELADGSWMVNSRINEGGMRYKHISADEGKTWDSQPEPSLIDPACNASIIRYDGGDQEKKALLFSNAKMEKGRKNMTVRISYDEGKTWSEGKSIYPGGAAYSSLTVLKNGDIGLLFEKDDYDDISFVSFSLKWLADEANH